MLVYWSVLEVKEFFKIIFLGGKQTKTPWGNNTPKKVRLPIFPIIMGSVEDTFGDFTVSIALNNQYWRHFFSTPAWGIDTKVINSTLRIHSEVAIWPKSPISMTENEVDGGRIVKLLWLGLRWNEASTWDVMTWTEVLKPTMWWALAWDLFDEGSPPHPGDASHHQDTHIVE